MKDDRGDLDLTKQIADLKLQLNTYKVLMRDFKKIKWEI